MKRAALFALVIASSAAMELESKATIQRASRRARGRKSTSIACENMSPGEEQDACFELRRQNQETKYINIDKRAAE